MEAKQKMQTEQNEKRAIVRGRDLPISDRHAATICSAISNKTLESSLKFMDEIVRLERGVKNEGGRVRITSHGAKYPMNTAKVFSKLLKSLSANATTQGMDASKLIIHGKADKASRPQRPGRRYHLFKRAHVTLEAFVPKVNVEKKEKVKENKK